MFYIIINVKSFVVEQQDQFKEFRGIVWYLKAYTVNWLIEKK